MLSRSAANRKATASKWARTICSGLVSFANPSTSPRKSSRHKGARSPAKNGKTVKPWLSGGKCGKEAFYGVVIVGRQFERFFAPRPHAAAVGQRPA